MTRFARRQATSTDVRALGQALTIWLKRDISIGLPLRSDPDFADSSTFAVLQHHIVNGG
jgi:hypothetical protein